MLPHGLWIVFLLFLMTTVLEISTTLPDVVKIGGLFNPEDDLQEIAFRYAVDRINMDRLLLPKTTLVPIIKRVANFDSFHTAKQVCNMTEEGVAAIFGPQSRNTAGMVQSICNNKEIPHLKTNWEPRASFTGNYQINLHPNPYTLAIAIRELIEDMGWKSFTVVYQHNDALIRLQEVLKNHDPNDAPITVRQLNAEVDDHRPLLKQIRASGESHVILDCDEDKILSILRQAGEVKMLGPYIGYLISTLDLHTVDLDEIKNTNTNITTLRIIDPDSQEINNAVHDWTYAEMRDYGRNLHITNKHVKTEVALMHDSVYLFARALRDLGTSQHIVLHSLSCDTRDTWEQGFSLVNWMRVMETRGLSGTVRFDSSGLRTDFALEVVEFRTEGMTRIATWDPHIGINRTISYTQIHDQIMEGMANKTFKVYAILGAPFLMRVQSKEPLTGNARFEGFSKDLIEEISKIRKFKYEFKLEPDNRYGNYDRKTKQWDGLVKQILDRKADFAICDLTITYDRERVVDFTMPFMNLGISILFSMPHKSPPSLFSFLSPLSVDVWIYMLTAYLGISVVLYGMARLLPSESENPHTCNESPAEFMWFAIGSIMQQGCDFLPKITPNEWISTHPCKTDTEEMENNLTLSNLIWHNCGSIMQQGSDIAPKAVSTRMVAGMWWFFTLIMISSYTANLAAFLTVERMDVTIESADDLAKQTKIKYGAVRGGSTAAFFRDSNFSTYQRMWSFMESTRPSVFTKSNEEGVERVQKSKRTYAFLMESTNIEYNTERKCDLTRVGGLLDSKGYGIAMPRNSPYRTLMSEAVLILQESGKLNELKNLWWQQKHGGGQCKVKKRTATAGPELGIANVGGVFVVLLGGLAAACVVGVFEFLWNTQKVAVEERAGYCEKFMEELKFAMNFRAVTKPVHKSKSTNSINRSYEKL